MFFTYCISIPVLSDLLKFCRKCPIKGFEEAVLFILCKCSSEKMKVQKEEVAAKLRRSRARSVTKAPKSGRQHTCDASLSTAGAQWPLLGSLLSCALNSFPCPHL